MARFLVITQYYRPETFRINDLVDWLAQKGHEVVVLTGVPNYPGGRYFQGYSLAGPWLEGDAPLRVVRVPLIPRGTGSGLRLALNYLSFALSASILGPLRCRGKFDAIFVHEPSPITVGIPAAVLRAIKRAPVFFWVLDLWPESLEATGAIRSPRLLKLAGRLTAWVYRHCDWILMQSRAFTDRITRFDVPAERLLYFPNWAEPSMGSAAQGGAASDKVELPAGFRVVFTGNMGESQALPVVLEAAEKLKGYADIRWILVGGGRIADWVHAEVERRGLAGVVQLPGAFPPERMPEFFAAADALLVSLRPEPIFALTVPAKVQAYLAAGRPIIASLDGEGARIVEESGAGLTAPAGDAEALAQRVLEMRALSPVAREEMGRRGREYGRTHFDREVVLGRLEKWLGGQDLPGSADARVN
jgi:colanic acid biosynthesis glycosyl transferase WcaI